LPNIPQATIGAGAVQLGKDILEIVEQRNLAKSRLENASRLLSKRAAEYQKQRERVPDLSSQVECFRAAKDRAERDHKIVDKAYQELVDRQTQDLPQVLGRLFAALGPYVPRPRGREKEAEQLSARIATLESTVRRQQDKHEQLENEMASQRLSFERVEKSVEKSVQKCVEGKLKGQRAGSEKQLEALRQELGRLQEDRTALRNDIARLERAVEACQKLSSDTKKVATDAQKAAADIKKEAQTATATGEKAFAESEKAISETQKVVQKAQQLLQPVTREITLLNSDMSVAKSRLDVLDAQQKRLPEELAGQEGTLQSLSIKVEEHAQRLNEVNPEQIDKLFWDLDEIRSRLDVLEPSKDQDQTGRQSPAEVATTPSSSNSKSQSNTAEALQVASEAVKAATATSKRLDGVIKAATENNQKMVSTFGTLIDRNGKRIADLEAKLTGQESRPELTEMKEKVERVSVKQEAIVSSLSETAGNTASLKARMEALDQMHRNLQSQTQNLMTQDLHDAIVGYVSRRYQDEFAEIRKDQNIIKHDQAEMKMDLAEIKSSLKALQGDSRDPKRRRLDLGVSSRTSGSY
jgi:chromosome segregation ATPase